MLENAVKREVRAVYPIKLISFKVNMMRASLFAELYRNNYYLVGSASGQQLLIHFSSTNRSSLITGLTVN